MARGKRQPCAGTRAWRVPSTRRPITVDVRFVIVVVLAHGCDASRVCEATTPAPNRPTGRSHRDSARRLCTSCGRRQVVVLRHTRAAGPGVGPCGEFWLERLRIADLHRITI